jgi:hypothetical protein
MTYHLTLHIIDRQTCHSHPCDRHTAHNRMALYRMVPIQHYDMRPSLGCGSHRHRALFSRWPHGARGLRQFRVRRACLVLLLKQSTRQVIRSCFVCNICAFLNHRCVVCRNVNVAAGNPSVVNALRASLWARFRRARSTGCPPAVTGEAALPSLERR